MLISGGRRVLTAGHVVEGVGDREVGNDPPGGEVLILGYPDNLHRDRSGKIRAIAPGGTFEGEPMPLPAGIDRLERDRIVSRRLGSHRGPRRKRMAVKIAGPCVL